MISPYARVKFLTSVDKISLHLLALILFKTNFKKKKNSLFVSSLWQDPELDHLYPTCLIKYCSSLIFIRPYMP